MKLLNRVFVGTYALYVLIDLFLFRGLTFWILLIFISSVFIAIYGLLRFVIAMERSYRE